MSHRAIVIDDNPDIREMFLLMLPLTGWEVIAAGAGGIRVEPPPDVYLIDIMLAGPMAGAVDGIEYAKRLRERGIRAPFIALSASTHQLEAAKKSGLFAACVAKPFDMFDLAGMMRELIGASDETTE